MSKQMQEADISSIFGWDVTVHDNEEVLRRS